MEDIYSQLIQNIEYVECSVYNKKEFPVTNLLEFGTQCFLLELNPLDSIQASKKIFDDIVQYVESISNQIIFFIDIDDTLLGLFCFPLPIVMFRYLFCILYSVICLT